LWYAAVAWFTSLETAVRVVVLAHFAAGIVLAWRLALAAGLPRGWAWAAAAFVGFSPLYLFMGLQAMSDGPALVWVAAAVLAAVRGRDDWRFAVAAGVATAMAVLVRPTNVLAALPVVVLLWPSWRAVAWWIAGGLPGAVFQAWLGQTLYGNPLETGYGSVGELFRWEFVGPTLAHYAAWVPALCTPLVLFAAGGPWVRSIERRVRLALVVWVAAFFGVYAFYWFTRETWWYLRFVLPAFPAVTVLMLAGAEAAARRAKLRLFEVAGGWWPAVATVALLALPLANAMGWSMRLPVLEAGAGNRVYPETARWLQEHAPEGAVVVCMQASGALYHYTPAVVVRYDTIAPAELAAALRRLRELGRPVYAVVFPSEVDDVRRRLSGRWAEAGRVRDVRIWRLEEIGFDTKLVVEGGADS
jgi:4-amino-4-deoxy-L-arabinose transferase-like glycosyltransferase